MPPQVELQQLWLGKLHRLFDFFFPSFRRGSNLILPINFLSDAYNGLYHVLFIYMSLFCASDMLSEFPPTSVLLKRPFAVHPWRDSEENVGNLLMVPPFIFFQTIWDHIAGSVNDFYIILVLVDYYVVFIDGMAALAMRTCVDAEVNGFVRREIDSIWSI